MSARTPTLFSFHLLTLLAIFGFVRPDGSAELSELPRKLLLEALRLHLAEVDRLELLKLGAILM